nr:MAG TPA: hypothetical protein [Caudoviricetes sp.]
MITDTKKQTYVRILSIFYHINQAPVRLFYKVFGKFCESAKRKRENIVDKEKKVCYNQTVFTNKEITGNS